MADYVETYLSCKLRSSKVPVRKYPDNDYYIIRHREIMKLINECEIEFSFGKTDPAIVPVKDGCEIVFTCYAKQKNYAGGMTAVAVGESNPENLFGEIGKIFPAEIASNRAIDRAVIQLLGFSEKVYSDSEIFIGYRHAEEKIQSQESMDVTLNPEPSNWNGLSFVPNTNEDEYQPPFASESANTNKPASLSDSMVGFVSESGDMDETPLMTDISSTENMLQDDEVILFGSCKGKKYGEVKDSIRFSKLVEYLKQNPTVVFDTDQKNEQARKIRSLTIGGVL